MHLNNFAFFFRIEDFVSGENMALHVRYGGDTHVYVFLVKDCGLLALAQNPEQK